MFKMKKAGEVNVKLIIIIVVVLVAIGLSFFAAREANRAIISKRNYDQGLTAYDQKDWAKAVQCFQKYLRYNPSDLDILEKYAQARMSTRPLDVTSISTAIAAYRRIIQLAPEDKQAYEKLAELYTIIKNFDELAYIAKTSQKYFSTDPNSQLWLARSQVGLRKYQEARATLKTLINTLQTLPQKPYIYVEACSLASEAASDPTSGGTMSEALDFLSRAVEAFPKSVEALAARAQFYRRATNILGLSNQDKLERAHKDLESADVIGTENLRLSLFLASEWLELGEPNKAEAELKVVENVPEKVIYEYYSDISDWTISKFLLISQIAVKMNNSKEYVPLADKVLTELTDRKYRVRILPSVVLLYLTAGDTVQARRYLDEYMTARYAQDELETTRLAIIYLQALVARAEEKPYQVINLLQPAVVMDESRADLWKLMAEAYIQTDQDRRAIDALKKYVYIKPDDKDTILLLANEYIKQQDWTRALETARLAESLDTTDILIRLLYIEATIYHTVEQNQKVDPSNFESVSMELSKLRNEHPERADIRILQAILADNLSKPEEAETELKSAIKECQDTLRAEMQLVSYYYRNKKINEAIETCRKACDNHNTVSEPWLVLSNLYVNMKDYTSAESVLSEGIKNITSKLQLRSLMIQRALIELLYIDRAKGIESLTQIAKQDPQEIRARTLLLNVSEIQSDTVRAQQLVDELKQAEGENGLYWRFYQAVLWLSADNWRSRQNDIINTIQQCIDKDPLWSDPVILLSRLYEKMGNLSQMEEVCRQALGRNPSATDIADILISVLENQGRFSDAQDVLSKVETNARISSTWNVRIAVNSGDFSRAIQELMLRVSNDDQDANSRILLARLLYWQNRDAQQAFALLKEVENISPDSIALSAAKVAILRAEGKSNEAQQILDTYVSHNDNFAAYLMRANYLSNIGQLEAAEKDYRKLTKFPDNITEGYQTLSDFYFKNNMLDKAVATLQEGLAADPENSILERRLIRILFTRNKDDDQKKAYEMLISLQKKLPDDPGLIALEALYILQKPTPENIQVARQKLEEVIKLEPTAVDAHLELISIAMEQQRYKDARDSAILALGNNPNNTNFLTARAKAELKLGNSQIALELAWQVLQKEPSNSEALSILISVNNPGLIEKAQTLIGSESLANPENLNLLVSLSRIYITLGQYDVAIKKLQEYINTNTENPNISAIVMLADLYRINGDMEKAQENIERAAQINPKSLSVIHSRFLLLKAQKKYNELSHISDMYLSADKPNTATLLDAGNALLSMDSPELKKEAIKLFEQTLEINPFSKSAKLYLATALYQTGDVESAIQHYQDLIQQYPDDVQILNNLAWILQEHEHLYKEALKMIDKALSLSPNDINLLDTRAVILTNMENRIEEARDEYEKIVELSPSNSPTQANALVKLGNICIKLEDTSKAAKYLQDALEINQTIKVFNADQVSEITEILQKTRK